METAEIVRTAVEAAPYVIDKPYDYLVPEALHGQVQPGIRAAVPFGKGNRECEGIILSVGIQEKRPGLKPLSAVLDEEPVLDHDDISLAVWMCRRYFCTFFEAARMILPAGLWYRLRENWLLVNDASVSDVSWKHAGEVTAYLREHGGSADWEELRKEFGEIRPFLQKMELSGILRMETAAARKTMDRFRRRAELAVPASDALASVSGGRHRSEMRYHVVRFLISAGSALCSDVCYYTGATTKLLREMEHNGLLILQEEEELRVPTAGKIKPGAPIVFNDEQQRAYEKITGLIHTGKASAVLLYGVTGSGKTLVYLKLVQDILRTGKNAMVLVPEIILTPQMTRTFQSYFGDEAALLHSSLRVTERYDQWKRIRRGAVRVVLGTRSAIFAPLRNLGLVILDEEQEGSYQSEQAPRYHTRDVARYLCARDKALLVLGSATPSVETAWEAEQGRIAKAELLRRYHHQNLPEVTIADLRTELRSGNPGLIGADLRRELELNLHRGEQSILLLNRRGNSRMLLCGECGHVPECPRCSMPMTYHSANRRLMCHYCGHSQADMEECPQCGGRMKHVGAGTQKIEEELRNCFPETEILRMDADTASGRQEKFLEKFEKERIPILLGTQMVAKGLDFENVTLAGVLLADQSLYMDHYRAAERTFSLLTQVTGRAGRGNKPGRAVIQTYTPDNDVIQSAAAQDYYRFYHSEIRLRRLRRYPPFADLFTLTVSGIEETLVLRAAVRVRDTLRNLCVREIFSGQKPEVLGPAPAPVLRVNNRFRYRVFWIGKNEKSVRDLLGWLLKEFARDRTNRGLYLWIDCNGPE